MDTIVAISTALGDGAISIIRLSGKDSIKVVNDIFSGNLLNKNSHTINYGKIISNNHVIDEVMISIMKAPKTYTREDIVEINCHGGILTSKKILELILSKGIRLALPGEFTKRAFINGRIDLLEAESINELLNANNETIRNNAVQQLSGQLSKKIKQFKDYLIDILANIEVNIDYPEYTDIEEYTLDKIKKSIKRMSDFINEIVKLSENHQIIKTGVKTVIIGKPNVGKSSILNKLLNENKAIVTNIPGTTRDVVEGALIIDGINYNFLDTAGIRETDDIVESYGVEKSKKLVEEADLIILVLNNNEIISEEDIELLNITSNKKRIIVLNKCDLEKKINLPNNLKYIELNTIESEQIEKLKQAISNLYSFGKLNIHDGNLLINARQISLSKNILEKLHNINNLIESSYPMDIIAIEIKSIIEDLSSMLGEVYNMEAIDRMFEKFCVGK